MFPSETHGGLRIGVLYMDDTEYRPDIGVYCIVHAL